MIKEFVSAAILAFLCPAAVAALAISEATYKTQNDLTRIEMDRLKLEFLDLSVTDGLTAADAQARYGAAGFEVAGYDAVQSLLRAFGFAPPAFPTGSYAALGPGNAEGFLSFLGITDRDDRSMGHFFAPSGTIAYFCVSGGSCSDGSFVNDSSSYDGSHQVGVLMVRATDLAPVPLPAAGGLLLVAFGGLLFLGRVRT